MDWNLLNNILNKSKNIVLSTHVNPDGDGLGSQLGLYYYLISLGKHCNIINTSKLPEHYKFLDPDDIIEHYDLKQHTKIFEDADVVISLDIGDYRRLNEISNEIKKKHIFSISIDHHPEKKNFLTYLL